ncbi:MAG: flagellar basal body rod protein FlgB [Oceanococcus sp.]
MASDFISGPLYGNLAGALKVHGQRLDVLSNNLANVDTPNFKARDVDFRSALKAVSAGSPGNLETTHSQHIATGLGDGGTHLRWRVPSQPSADGNTVDASLEKARFGEAALRYEATLRFIDGRVKSVLTAITGQ